MKKMKSLTPKTLERRKLVLKAIEDYFGGKIDDEKFNRISTAIRKTSTKDLDEEERKAVWTIDANLNDPVYVSNLKGAKL